MLVPVLQPSGHLLFAKAFSSMALQLYGRLICEHYVIKHLDLFKVFLVPVQSLLFICIPNHLTVSGSGEGPAKLKAKSCNGSHTILNICGHKFFVKISLRAEAVSSSFPVINATIMAFWNSFWWCTSGEVSHIASLLPSCDCALDCLACSDYPLHGENSCNFCHCHFLTRLGPHGNNSSSLIVT